MKNSRVVHLVKNSRVVHLVKNSRVVHLVKNSRVVHLVKNCVCCFVILQQLSHYSHVLRNDVLVNNGPHM